MPCENENSFIGTIKQVKATLNEEFLAKLFNYGDIYKKIIEIRTLLLLRYEEAKEFATIATRAKDISIQKAKESLDSANSAHLSALFAGDRADWIDENTKEIRENIELIKLSPKNAQIAIENATISTNAKNVAITKAKEALDSANSAHLSALFTGERAEYVDEVSIVIDREKNQILGAIDVHNRFIELSQKEIKRIELYLLKKAEEASNAKDKAVESARVSLGARNEAIGAKNKSKTYLANTLVARNEAIGAKNISKSYLDDVVKNKNIVIDLKNKTATFRDESKEFYDKSKTIYNELKDVGSAYDIKKEIYTLRTGTLFETRGEL